MCQHLKFAAHHWKKLIMLKFLPGLPSENYLHYFFFSQLEIKLKNYSLLHSYQGHIQLFRDRDSEEKSEGAPSLAHNNHLPTLT